ncbi:MAG: FtsQ-type POTRA domain-containing protein [Desulfovibrio sp.]|nr:FtsQ-type POTRA domain-containing protein [Desulfovibrio sp.]
MLGVCILVSLAGLALGIGKIFVWLYDVAVTSDFFTTHVIEVSGNVRLPRDVVLDYAGIREGQNSLAVNIASVEQNLRRTPWVESVSVKRLLPDKFVIRIHERMPSFWVHRDGVLYYASEEGEIIAPVESSNFLSLPALSVEQGADQLRPYLARFKESVRTGDLPVDVAQVSQITLSLSKGLELFLEDRELWLSFDPRDWEKNVLRIKRVFADLIKRREMKNVREMRVVEGNVWLVLNQSAKQLPGVQ